MEPQQQPVMTPQLFASPDEAVKTLQAATQAKDKAALRTIFGSQVQELLTGDDVQDANNAQKFAGNHGTGLYISEESDDKIII